MNTFEQPDLKNPFKTRSCNLRLEQKNTKKGRNGIRTRVLAPKWTTEAIRPAWNRAGGLKYTLMENSIAENIEIIRQKISAAALRSGRRPGGITLVAVSKTVPADLIKAAHEAGVADFGENRIQEAAGKIKTLPGLPIRWHFIGHLQTNKAKAAIDMGFELIHTVDSVKLLTVLEEHAKKTGKSQRALVEVKLSEEPSKHGTSEEGLLELLRAAEGAEHIKIEGLMGMPPYFQEAERARPYFARLRALKEKAEKSGCMLQHLSMGMSHDFEIAIEEGATLVRIGTAIFGGQMA